MRSLERLSVVTTISVVSGLPQILSGYWGRATERCGNEKWKSKPGMRDLGTFLDRASTGFGLLALARLWQHSGHAASSLPPL